MAPTNSERLDELSIKVDSILTQLATLTTTANTTTTSYTSTTHETGCTKIQWSTRWVGFLKLPVF